MEQVAPGVWRWYERSERLGYDLNGTFWHAEGRGVAVDPPTLTDAARERMADAGKPDIVVVTNHTHWRQTDELRSWSGAEVAMSEVDARAVAGEVDWILHDGDELPGGWRVLAMPGKTLGEIALYRESEGGVLVVGDDLIGDPPGRLRLLPPEKIDDMAQLEDSLAKLDALRFEALLVGDGEPIRKGADRVVRDFVRELL